MNHRHRQFMPADAIPWLLLVAAAFSVKYHFSGADARDLSWILKPTAALVGMAAGISFDPEPAVGFICREESIIIAPSCSGVNFLIISFCAAAITGWGKLRTVGAKTAWLVAAAGIACGATLAANTLRIIISMWLFHAEFYTAWISPENAHRILGILVYLPGLYLVHFMIKRLIPETGHLIFNRSSRRPFLLSPLPAILYGTVTLLIPLCNSIRQGGRPMFISHLLTVAAGILLIYAFLSCVRLSFVIIRRKISGPASE